MSFLEGMFRPREMKHKVRRLVDVPDEVVSAAQEAATLVWERNIGTPTVMRYTFASRITDRKTGEDTGIAAQYNPGRRDSFTFALERIEEQPVPLSFPEKTFLSAAHEVTHKVQAARGETLRPTPTPPDEEYDNDPHEIEAWDEALHAFKFRYPNASGSISVGPNTFHVPDRSRYTI